MRMEKKIQKIISEFTEKRTIEHYLFAYKQLSKLLPLHSYTFYLVCHSVIVRVSVVLKKTVGDSD